MAQLYFDAFDIVLVVDRFINRCDGRLGDGVICEVIEMLENKIIIFLSRAKGARRAM